MEEKGTGQGSVISPLLANVYLHYVFDLWAERWRRREATGDVIIVRYADDIVVGFQHESDARRFWDAMRERLREFSLSLHPDKTRLIEFGRFAAQTRREARPGQAGNLQVPGLHAHLRENTRGTLPRHEEVARDRMRAKLKEIKEELRRMMHRPIPEQGKWLWQVLSGWFAYHAVPTNCRALQAFRYHVTTLWRRSLSRRSQRGASHLGPDAENRRRMAPEAENPSSLARLRFAVRHPR